MQKPIYNLQRKFNHWFFDEQYPEQGSNRAQAYSYGNPQNSSNRDYWMLQAFQAGAQSLWQDIDHTLLQYATSCEGLEPEMLEPCEVFDRARENLHLYIHHQLRLFP